VRSGRTVVLLIITTVVSIAIAVVSLVTLMDYPRAGALVAIAAPIQDIDIGSFDRLLDLYVRDGLVYYAALRSDRVGLDRFVSSLRTEPVGFDTQLIDVRKAFWLNAYNALTLETVINHYPIRGQSLDYPSNSIRQMPGAVDSGRLRSETYVPSRIEEKFWKSLLSPLDTSILTGWLKRSA